MGKKLYKSKSDSKISGVCGGIAKYFGVDSTLVRVAWIVFSCMGAGIFAYIFCAIIMPNEPESSEFYKSSDE